MHDSAYRIGELIMRTYCDLPRARVLEIGSMNVNGCLRDLAAPTTDYVGLDIEAGPAVDLVVGPGEDFPVENDSFDLVMASSVFEHDSRFWETFVRMCRAARPGGHVYVNAPSNGTVHRYPRDCWRFYPDAGLAFAEHARSCGIELDFVESFISLRHSDVWNDFVAVFRKGPSPEPLNTAFVYQRYPTVNARTWQSHDIYNGSELTEDMGLIAELRGRAETLQHEVALLTSQSTDQESLRADLDRAREQIGELEARLSHSIDRANHTSLEAQFRAVEELSAQNETRALRAECDLENARTELALVKQQIETLHNAVSSEQLRHSELHQEVTRLSQALDEAEAAAAEAREAALRSKDFVSSLESNLRQRQEEIEQAWAQVDEGKRERDRHAASEDALRAMVAKLENRVVTADKWVFDLARHRQMLEADLTKLRIAIEAADKKITKVESSEANLRAEAERARGYQTAVSSGLIELNHCLADHSEQQADITALHRRWVDEAHPLTKAAAAVGSLLEASHGLSQSKSALHNDVEVLVERLAANERAAKISADHDSQSQTIITSLDARCAEKDRQLAWFRQVYDVMAASNKGWRAILPPLFKRKRGYELLYRHGLFNSEAYLQRYPDVASAGVDPLRHYIRFGMPEGRHLDAPG